jgi:hypothetical protein
MSEGGMTAVKPIGVSVHWDREGSTCTRNPSDPPKAPSR